MSDDLASDSSSESYYAKAVVFFSFGCFWMRFECQERFDPDL